MNSIPEGLEVEVEQQQSEAAIPSHHPEKFEGEEQSTTSDDLILSRLGKKPVLKRRFGLIPIIAFNCLNLNSWGTAFQVIGIGLTNGGPGGSIWGWIFVWCGASAVFSCLAELASMSPTSAGQYHWSSLLAPASTQKFISYVTGWLTVLGWQAGISASCYISGTIIQALIGLVNTSYDPQLWHGTLLVYGVLAVCFFFTVILGKFLHLVETTLLVIYVLGFFVVLIPMVALAPQHATGKTVFTTFINGGGWPTQGLSFFVGISGWAFATLGADGAVHMSEEVHNAAVTVPRSIMIGLAVNSIIGTAMLLAELFCIPDPVGLVDMGLSYPFVQVFLDSTNSVVGSALMITVIIVVQIGLNISNVAAASRILWAFSRDRGVPGWRYVSQVEGKSRLPLTAIIISTVVPLLLVLISIGSYVAFNDVISLTIDSLFSSYLLVCSLLLWRRCTGTIAPHSEHSVNAPGAAGKLTWGPYHIRGAFGIFVNCVACVYMTIILFFSVWPPVTPTTAAGMNYAIVMFSGVGVLAAVYYLAWARKTYKGPVVETFEL
ncbi:hypothetical protein MMC10_003169 [Thelotrema lepadinum]|nr:hypothetical protein [Thelotrema lepadinum]